ncbi:MAG: GNAT family N-acetyltransferase [Candidatus Heimdallarchaeota archaeon]|nr:MAG: GNAT family N-acetyltransferase [Candidatus Heimdallarchaeota archaeon]
MYSVTETNQDCANLDYWDFQVEFQTNSQFCHFNINSLEEVFMGEPISLKRVIDQKKTINCFIDIGEEIKDDFLRIGSFSLAWKAKKNECYIGTLWIEPEFRGNGLSTYIFEELTEIADELGITLTLHAMPFISPEKKPTDEEILKLKNYYHRFGFKENSEMKGIGFDCLMERIPNEY